MKLRLPVAEDFEYMTEHCINRSREFKQLDAIDELVTLEHDGIPLLVGGFRMINSSTAWCWIDMSDDVSSNLIPVFRVIKGWIDMFIKERDLTRLQSFVRTDFDAAIRMVEHLGFKRESTMKDFFRDGDAFMYTRRPDGRER